MVAQIVGCSLGEQQLPQDLIDRIPGTAAVRRQIVGFAESIRKPPKRHQKK